MPFRDTEGGFNFLFKSVQDRSIMGRHLRESEYTGVLEHGVTAPLCSGDAISGMVRGFVARTWGKAPLARRVPKLTVGLGI